MAGFAKARLMPGAKNDLFNWKSIIIAAFYTSDFFSDIFFCVQLAIISYSKNWKSNSNSKFFILFILSATFIVVPFLGNLIPLHFEIQKWTKDPIIKSTSVPQWIKRNAKFLYLVSVITGSSFSGIALVNSFLFKSNALSMGLPHYCRSIFQNKRFYSVVLLEVCALYGCMFFTKCFVVFWGFLGYVFFVFCFLFGILF